MSKQIRKSCSTTPEQGQYLFLQTINYAIINAADLILQTGGKSMYFEYGDIEKDYLRNKDKKMGELIDRIGHIYRPVDPDLFASVVHHIIGQQISSKAQATIWQRLNDYLGVIDAAHIIAAGIPMLQSMGLPIRKAQYITGFAALVYNGDFDINALSDKSDDEVVKALSSVNGIGVWTAEMIMMFCMQRPDILSYDDLAIQRGLRMVYRHRQITPELFEKYRRRFSPYGSVASLYLWAVSAGAVSELKDPAVSRKFNKENKSK